MNYDWDTYRFQKKTYVFTEKHFQMWKRHVAVQDSFQVFNFVVGMDQRDAQFAEMVLRLEFDPTVVRCPGMILAYAVYVYDQTFQVIGSF